MPAGKRQYSFVLWGERFEELAAVAFVTSLREAGLAVKVVGLSRRPAAGVHGLRLMHDLTVEEAMELVYQVRVLVIPCGRMGAQLLIDDPRIHQLLQQACDHHPLLFSTPSGIETLATLPGFSSSAYAVMMIPPDEYLVRFVRKISRQLLVDGVF